MAAAVAGVDLLISEVLILGGDGSGKSLLVRRLKDAVNNNGQPAVSEPIHAAASDGTMPTVGVEINEIEYGGNRFKLREIGSAISLRWNVYIPECQYLIYVIDVSDAGSLGASMVLLHEVLSSGKDLEDKPMLIAFNKADLCNVRSHTMAMNMLRVEELLQQFKTMKVITGSCIGNSLAVGVLKWLQMEQQNVFSSASS